MNRKRVFALLLAVCLVASILPVPALAEGEESPVYYCDFAEEHTHSDDCYRYLNCGKDEHTCGEACAEVKELTEAHDEVPVHTDHTEACAEGCQSAHDHVEGQCAQNEDGTWACGCLTAHTHTDGCYTVTKEACTQENHAHAEGEEGCYAVAEEAQCGKTEHTHTDECQVAPTVDCTHTYSPWDWFVDEADENNNTFLRTCGLCQAEERNYMPDAVVGIMTATPEDALATKAALEQAVADGVLTQGAAQLLIDTLGIMPTVDAATINGIGYPTLADAMEAVGDGGTATIELADGTHTMPAGKPNNGGNWKTSNVTFTGSKNAIIDIPNTVYNDDGKFTFDGVTVNFPATGDYYGIAHIDEIIYSNCFINGKQTLYAATSAFNNCAFNNKSDYSVWTWNATSVTFSGCTFDTGGKAVLVYGGSTYVILTDSVFKSEKTLNKAAVETGDDYGATYTVTINNCSADSGFVLNKSTSPLWGNKNEMDYKHLIVNLDGVEVTAPYVDMSGITLKDKVYDGKELTYTGEAAVRTYRIGLDTANDGTPVTFTYQWLAKDSSGNYVPLNTSPKEVGEYKLVATTTAEINRFVNKTGEILVKIEKAPAPSTGTNTNTNTIYVYSGTKLLQTGAEMLSVGLMAFAGISLMAASMWLLRKKSYER